MTTSPKILCHGLENAQNHTMEDSLYGYLEMKMHHRLSEFSYSDIEVIGKFDRVTAEISTREKTGKLFNWQRPTARIVDGNLQIMCYPGTDYVRHYAEMIATYLNIHNRNQHQVYYYPPGESDCWSPINHSNLLRIPVTRTVILGFGLDKISGSPQWQGDGNFLWAKSDRFGEQVTFVGCKNSIWGDIGGRIVTALAKQGFQQVIYIGKLGAMKTGYIPNMHLATGNRSILGNETITWDNPFHNVTDQFVRQGVHVCSPSIVLEDKAWLNQNHHDFVDPEIGHMAKASRESGIGFGYLHIISNNLAERYMDDLSNERKTNIIAKREALLERISQILVLTLNS